MRLPIILPFYQNVNLDIIPKIKEILGDSILLGVERIVHTDNKGTSLYGCRLYNLYEYDTGNEKIPHCLACTVVQKMDKAEGYVFQNIENITVDQGLPGLDADMSSPVNGNTYTVSQLYNAVKNIARYKGGLKYSEEEKRKYLFHYTERNDGTRYSSRDEEYMELAQNPEQNSERLQEIVDQAAKDAGYTKKRFHETKAENIIHVFDLSRNTNSSADYQTPFTGIIS